MLVTSTKKNPKNQNNKKRKKEKEKQSISVSSASERCYNAGINKPEVSIQIDT